MRLSLTLALVAGLAVPFEARAQDCPDAHPRTLLGHTFAHPSTIGSAFIDTYFGTRTSGRYETLYNLTIGDVTTDINSLGVSEQVDFALALGNKFSVGVGMFGRTLFGTNGRALATAGALYSYGAILDAGFRVVRIEESGTQIAVRGEVFGVQGGGRISLLPFIRAVREDPSRDVPNALLNLGDLLITPISRVGAAASINVAQAISRVFSVQASFRLDVRRTTQSPFVLAEGRRVDVASTHWAPQGGLAVGVSPPWPVTFAAEYRIASQDSQDPTAGARQMVALAAYYAGRPDLQVGPVVASEFGLPELQGVALNGDVKHSDRATAIAGQLMMRYYW